MRFANCCKPPQDDSGVHSATSWKLCRNACPRGCEDRDLIDNRDLIDDRDFTDACDPGSRELTGYLIVVNRK